MSRIGPLANQNDLAETAERDQREGDENDGLDAAHANALFMLRPIAIPSGS